MKTGVDVRISEKCIVDDYFKARQKAIQAEDTSNLESEAEINAGRPRRKR